MCRTLLQCLVYPCMVNIPFACRSPMLRTCVASLEPAHSQHVSDWLDSLRILSCAWPASCMVPALQPSCQTLPTPNTPAHATHTWPCPRHHMQPRQAATLVLSAPHTMEPSKHAWPLPPRTHRTWLSRPFCECVMQIALHHLCSATHCTCTASVPLSERVLLGVCSAVRPAMTPPSPTLGSPRTASSRRAADA
jgi:hypothetical protein